MERGQSQDRGKVTTGVTTVGKLQGKVAVITGGTTGIGFAAAKLFVEEGAYVFITGRRRKELDEAVQVIGDNVTGVQGDVSKLRAPHPGVWRLWLPPMRSPG